MNCMKCGREIPSGQVFCEDCLADMAKYPVDPDTPVAIPQRNHTIVQKKSSKRRNLSSEEQIAVLRQRIRILTVLLVVAVLLVAALLYPTIEHLMEDDYAPGQNYSSITPTSEAAAPETAP